MNSTGPAKRLKHAALIQHNVEEPLQLNTWNSRVWCLVELPSQVVVGCRLTIVVKCWVEVPIVLVLFAC